MGSGRAYVGLEHDAAGLKYEYWACCWAQPNLLWCRFGAEPGFLGNFDTSNTYRYLCNLYAYRGFWSLEFDSYVHLRQERITFHNKTSNSELHKSVAADREKPMPSGTRDLSASQAIRIDNNEADVAKYMPRC